MIEKQTNLRSFLSGNNDAMTRASSLRRIEEISTACDKIPLARLFLIMLRKKGEVQNDPYNWSDKTFLKKLEQYRKEFSETYNPVAGDFSLNEDFINED